jgi:hypothetical protein
MVRGATTAHVPVTVMLAVEPPIVPLLHAAFGAAKAPDPIEPAC